VDIRALAAKPPTAPAWHAPATAVEVVIKIAVSAYEQTGLCWFPERCPVRLPHGSWAEPALSRQAHVYQMIPPVLLFDRQAQLPNIGLTWQARISDSAPRIQPISPATPSSPDASTRE